MTTVRDVARVAGVSTATVSRVLNDKPNVRSAIRGRVLQAMAELGYQPSRVARRLRSRRAQVIGLIISDIQNPFFTSVVRGVEDVAYAHNYTLLLCNSDENLEKERLYVDLMRAEGVAGIILSPTHEVESAANVRAEDGLPIVCLDRRLRGVAADLVIVDNVTGAYQAVSHLIRLGHRRIGLLVGPAVITSGLERQRGYEQALRDHGLPVEPELIYVGDFKQTGGFRGAETLLTLNPPPTALFAANNLTTLGALNAIHTRRLRIPDDVALVGFDDMPWAPSLDPPLTAVAQPTYDLGSTAAGLLLARIDDPGRPVQEVILRPTLVVRQSCGGRSDAHSESESAVRKVA